MLLASVDFNRFKYNLYYLEADILTLLAIYDMTPMYIRTRSSEVLLKLSTCLWKYYFSFPVYLGKTTILLLWSENLTVKFRSVVMFNQRTDQLWFHTRPILESCEVRLGLPCFWLCISPFYVYISAKKMWINWHDITKHSS